MAKKKKKAVQINLLQKEDFSATTAGRVLSWILSTFRIIVIVTEILVMLAFLSRFWLDAQNTDLNEQIKQKQAVLVASLPFEKDFKDTQARLKIFSGFAEEEGIIADSFGTISSRLPPDVLLNSIAYIEGGVEIQGFAVNEKSIQQFIVNLYDEGSIEEVTLGKVAFNLENQLLSFTLTVPSFNQGE
jgi:Tfp pilus assembly protein PilN